MKLFEMSTISARRIRSSIVVFNYLHTFYTALSYTVYTIFLPTCATPAHMCYSCNLACSCKSPTCRLNSSLVRVCDQKGFFKLLNFLLIFASEMGFDAMNGPLEYVASSMCSPISSNSSLSSSAVTVMSSLALLLVSVGNTMQSPCSAMAVPEVISPLVTWMTPAVGTDTDSLLMVIELFYEECMSKQASTMVSEQASTVVSKQASTVVSKQASTVVSKRSLTFFSFTCIIANGVEVQELPGPIISSSLIDKLPQMTLKVLRASSQYTGIDSFLNIVTAGSPYLSRSGKLIHN